MCAEHTATAAAAGAFGVQPVPALPAQKLPQYLRNGAGCFSMAANSLQIT